jgi:hypothetical protein
MTTIEDDGVRWFMKLPYFVGMAGAESAQSYEEAEKEQFDPKTEIPLHFKC